jgi:hypothetical protein
VAQLTLEQRLDKAVDDWFVKNHEYIDGCCDSYMMRELKDALKGEVKLEALRKRAWTL